jgi:hypothetical protein
MGQWPSAELKPPEPGKGQVAAVFWWLLFALTAVGILGGVGRSVKEYAHPGGFERVGLAIEPAVGACFGVMPKSRAATAQWPESIDSTNGGCLTRVGDMAVVQSTPASAVAERLDGRESSKVEVELTDGVEGPETTVSFRRQPVGDWLDIGVLIVRTIVSVLFAAVALALRQRRSADPIALRISFAFVLMAQMNPVVENYWRSSGASGTSYLAGIVGVLILGAVFPAFPDGVYAPRWARWLRVVLPLGVVIAGVASLLGQAVLAGLLVVGLFLLSLVLLVLRYFRMPRGREKQQVKWAVGGMAAGILLASAGFVISEPRGLLETNPQLFNLQMAAVDLLINFGLGLLPAGVGISLLEYRLNDADAVAGKSLGYAIVTVVVGVVWALVQSVVGDFARSWAGNQAATTAITTVIAALVITPTRAYVLAWTEKKFQPALVHFRKLPEKLDRWQTCQSPEELAAATLEDLVKGVGAAHAAILGDDGREWRVLAANGIDPETAMAQLAAERPADRSQDPFPIRRELADQLGQPDLLAIGPRSDGASFTRDEKAAIALILEPLANAIEAAALRERHVLKVENSLVGIDQRLARLEVELTPGSASRRSPKGSSAAGRSSRT